MRKSFQIAIPCLAMLIALIFPAAGQASEEGNYRLEFFVGVNVPIEKHFEIGAPQSDVIIRGTQDFSPGGQGGVRIGYDGARFWGMDYAYSYGINATKLSTQFGSFSFRNQFHQASSNVLFYPWSLDHKHVFPYLTAGMGATFVVLNQKTINEALTSPFSIGPLKSETVFAFNAGVGVRFRLSRRIGIRLDERDYISQPLRYGLPKSSPNPNAPVLPASGIFQQLAGTASLVIHF